MINWLIPKPQFRKLLLVFWVLFLIPFLLIGAMLIQAAYSDLPTIETLENPKSNLASLVYTSDGKIIGQYFRENRVNIGYKELPEHLVNALIATEDERFYTHSGIDFRALLRVVKGVLTGSTSQGGGSTITQQLAKMLFSEPAQTSWGRVQQKFQEWIISVQLERRYTKSEIVSMYLNRFDFINNAVGIQSASSVYFNKLPSELKLEEAAVLVGMAKNPALYNPNSHPESSLSRRNTVLYQMKRNDLISEMEFDSLSALPIELDFHRVSHTDGLAPYFREVLRNQLGKLVQEKDEKGNYIIAKKDGSRYDIYSDGLKVYTTIDSRLQEHAEWAVYNHMANFNQVEFFKDLKNKKNAPFDSRITDEEVKQILWSAIRRSDRYREMIEVFNADKNRSKKELEDFRNNDVWKAFNAKTKMRVFSYQGDIDTIMSPLDSIKYYKSFLRCGFVSIEPATGFVKAWVGGINYKHFKYDHVQLGTNQVGSTFKPFVYASGIREGLNPCEIIPNVQVCFDMPAPQPKYCPKNSDGKYEGVVTLKEGLAKSMNNVTAWVLKKYGPEAVIKLAKDLGITADLQAVPSLCLGVADINVLEMVAANASFANKGVYVKPSLISRIEDKDGNVIYNAIPETKEAIDEASAYTILKMMEGVVNFGTGNRLRRNLPYGNLPYPIAGKTGTTQNNSDSWFIGITPDLVSGVWVGGEDRAIRFSRTALGQGASGALPIWGYYMNRAYKDSTLNISTSDFQRPSGVTVNLDCGAVNNDIDFDSEENFDL